MHHSEQALPNEGTEQPAHPARRHGGDPEHEDGVEAEDGTEGGAEGVHVCLDEGEPGDGAAGGGEEGGEEGVPTAGAAEGEVGVPC